MVVDVIEVARDFSPTPGGRFAKNGPFSGEEFRKKVLTPRLLDAINRGGELKVILDGAAGYGGSFLEEAFGGLVRVEGFTKEQLDRSLKLVAERSIFTPFKDMATRYIRLAA